jgi:hypothetical protein
MGAGMIENSHFYNSKLRFNPPVTATVCISEWMIPEIAVHIQIFN